MSTTNETAICMDCRLEVQYQDSGYWPWRGIDGSDMCRTQRSVAGNEVRWPHRVSQPEAQQVFTAFQERTGTPAAHR